MNKLEGWVEFPEQERIKLGTEHLPTDVVKQEVVIGMWSTTDDDNDRQGLFAEGITIGGRNNPILTPAEKEYVAAIIDLAKERLLAKS